MVQAGAHQDAVPGRRSGKAFPEMDPWRMQGHGHEVSPNGVDQWRERRFSQPSTIAAAKVMRAGTNAANIWESECLFFSVVGQRLNDSDWLSSFDPPTSKASQTMPLRSPMPDMTDFLPSVPEIFHRETTMLRGIPCKVKPPIVGNPWSIQSSDRREILRKLYYRSIAGMTRGSKAGLQSS